MRRLSAALIALILVPLVWSCAGHPAIDDALPPAPGGTSRTLFVTVSEMGSNTPLEGVQLRVTFFPMNATLSARTNASGEYAISIPTAASSIVVSVDGTKEHEGVSKSGTLASGDTRFSVELDRRNTYTLSGVAFEATPNGPVPVEGVVVDAFVCELNCAINLEVIATTDRNGRYSIPGLWSGHETGLWIIKAGYTVDGPKPTRPCDLCDRLFTASGDSEIDIPLIRQ